MGSGHPLRCGVRPSSQMVGVAEPPGRLREVLQLRDDVVDGVDTVLSLPFVDLHLSALYLL